MAKSPTQDAHLTEPVVLDGVQVTVRHRPWLIPTLGWGALALALSPLVIMMIAGAIFGAQRPDWFTTYVWSVWAVAVVSGLVAGSLSTLGKCSAIVRVRDDALVVDRGVGGMRLAPENIARGTAVPGVGALFELARGGTVVVESRDVEAVERLLAQLNLSADKRRFETAIRPGPARPLLGCGGLIGIVVLLVVLKDQLGMVPTSGLVFLLSIAAMVTVLVFATRPPQIHVGADGVTLQRKIAKRFVPLGDIEAVRVDGHRLRLILHDGREETVRVPERDRGDLEAARFRIALGLAAHADGPDAPARLRLLKRGERSVKAWQHDLERIVADDQGYRGSALSRDDLITILQAPTTTSEQRVGAALALAARDGDEAAPKIRIAAEACASAETRKALLSVVTGEAAAIEEALSTS